MSKAREPIKKAAVYLQLPDRLLVVDGYFNSDLDSFFVHAPLSRGVEPIRRKKCWIVSHRGTSRKLPLRPLTFNEALRVAAAVEAELEGASQIEHQDGFEHVGWSDDMTRKVRAVCERMGVLR